MSNMVKYYLLRLAFFWIGGCFLANGGQTNAPVEAKVPEILADMQKWKSKRVEIRGFIRTGMELSAVYSSMGEAKQPYLNSMKGLWVNYGGSLSEVKNIKEGYVRIVGTFDFYPGQRCGHMNQWPAEITKIEIIELLTQPGNDPGADPY